MKKVIFFAAALAISVASCKNGGKGAAKLENSTDSLSYALGVSIATNLSESDLNDVNYDAFMKGIQEQMEAVAQMDLETAEMYIRSQMQLMSEKKGEENKVVGEKYLEENKTKPGVITTASGLQYKVNQEGSGISPDANDRVTVHYHGTTIDGTVFDSSVDRGQPATFGLNQVIPGWTEGLQLMKKGAKYTFYIPQNLAYGARATGKIQPYSTLIFEVELIDVEPVQ
ncbi:MAG: FKBP-type peptidyl-prolyl cis-trans isomerase [Flavobacteriales bacterium]